MEEFHGNCVPSLLQGALEGFGVSEAKCLLAFPWESRNPKTGWKLQRKTELKTVRMTIKFSFHLLEERHD